MKIDKLDANIGHLYDKIDDNVLIVAAGFEQRVLASSLIFKRKRFSISTVLILNYPDKELNKANCLELKKICIKITNKVIDINIGGFEKEINELNYRNKTFLIDITGMTRIAIFYILHFMEKNKYNYNIIYTEAEIYFPKKDFYDLLCKDATVMETSFIRYLTKEKAPMAYSYNCSIIDSDLFAGNPEPGRPAMLIAFLTFKRSRLQIILQKYEFENKVFILSDPVRDDLKWRKYFLEIVHHDLILKYEKNVFLAKTLYPYVITDLLETIAFSSREYSNYNIMLAPLGSKLQTIGSYYFWKKHPEVTVLFSQPKEYFKDSYSESYRDTFIIFP